MKKVNKIREVSINWETGDVTFFFEDSDSPWSLQEFKRKSSTYARLRRIETHVQNMFQQIKREDKAIERFIEKGNK